MILWEGMNAQDARSLPSHVQMSIRKTAVELFLKGRTQLDIASILGVTRQAVGRWIKAYKTGGKAVLKAKQKGRPKGCSLKPWQAAQVAKSIRNYCPDELGLPFYLWTREAVATLINHLFNLTLSRWTVGRYLKRWGFSFQKPIRRAIEQNPESIQKWLTTIYPAIQSQAKRESAEILWGDEMGLRSDHQTGKTYGVRGTKTIVKRTGKRFGCNMISVISNQGTLRFMVFRESFKINIFLTFLRRLVRQQTKKIFLIVDQHPVHRSKKVCNWLKKHVKQIQVFFLPGYCPELNPDELLNQDVKGQALSKQRPTSQDEMLKCVINHLRMRQKQPAIIKRFVAKIYTSYYPEH